MVTCFSAICKHEFRAIENQPHWACHMFLLFILLNSLACSLLYWPFITHSRSPMTHAIQGWVETPSQLYSSTFFTSVEKKCPNLACWRLAACDQAQGDHVCVWSQRAKLKSPINALICGAAKVRKGLSLFSPCHLCAPGCDLSWMSVSLAGGSRYSYGGWKRVVLCNPWCNSTNWSR